MKTHILLKVALLLTLALSSCRVVPYSRPMGPRIGMNGGMNQGPVGRGSGRQKIDHGHQGGWAQKMTNGKPDGPPIWIPGARPASHDGIDVVEDQQRVNIPRTDLENFLGKYKNNTEDGEP